MQKTGLGAVEEVDDKAVSVAFDRCDDSSFSLEISSGRIVDDQNEDIVEIQSRIKESLRATKDK